MFIVDFQASNQALKPRSPQGHSMSLQPNHRKVTLCLEPSRNAFFQLDSAVRHLGYPSKFTMPVYIPLTWKVNFSSTMSNFVSPSFEFPVLNPNIYLNYLPPSNARQFEISRDLYLVSFGALICDILVTLPADLAIIKAGFRPSLIAYLLSRLSTLVLVLLSVIAETKPLAHCSTLELTISLFWVVAVASTSCLLLRRVYDVLHEYRLVFRFFVLMGLINIGISALMPIGSHATGLAQTGYCLDAVRRFIIVTAISRLMFDLCVYVVIVHRIATMEGLSGKAVAWRTILSGKAPYRLTRALFRDGQQYYLVIVTSNILLVSLMTSHGVPSMYKAMFPISDIALTASMTCRVYRNLKVKTDKIDNVMSSMLFSVSRPTIPISEVDSSRSNHIISRRSPSQTVPDSIGYASTRLREGGERYSIIKIKPSIVSSSSTTSGDTPDSPV